MKRYWPEICAALFLAVVISCFGGVIVYASSAEQQITDQMELTDLQSMVDEMLGEKTFSVTEAFPSILVLSSYLYSQFKILLISSLSSLQFCSIHSSIILNTFHIF